MLGGVDASLVMQVLLAIVAAGAVYGGIRSDLRAMRGDLMRLERIAEKAHARLDSMGGGGRRYDEDRNHFD